MNRNYTDELFLIETEKIANKYNGEIIYCNILTRQFWIDCPKGVEEIISFEIERLIAEFVNNYIDFEEDRETTIDGWPVNIGEAIR